jgi:hypothetical protein
MRSDSPLDIITKLFFGALVIFLLLGLLDALGNVLSHPLLLGATLP